MPFTIADECGIFTFFEPLDRLGAADAAGVHQEDLERVLLEQLEEAVALQVVRRGKNGFVPGTRRNLPASAAPPARGALRLAEHEVGRRLRPLELRDGRDDVLVPVQDRGGSAPRSIVALGGRLDHAERERRAAVLRVRGVEEVDVVAVSARRSRGTTRGCVTAPWIVGSSSGFSPNVFAKQPFSVTSTRPSGIHATKSSCTGSEPFCRVNVVVVLPVPDSPTMSPTLVAACRWG